MEVNQEYLDKVIHWVKLRCYGNVKVHSENVLAFVNENGKSTNGQIQMQVAFSEFKELTKLHDELCNIEPNRHLRGLYSCLADAIINEDYTKAEKYRNRITFLKK